MTDAIVRMSHIRQVHQCSGGARLFFQRYGLDWTDFLKNGIPAQRLLDTKDALARKVVEAARGQQ